MNRPYYYNKEEHTMASNQTANYQLNQWSESDRVLRTDFNADNEKLDAALASMSTQIAAKANQEEVNGLKNVVATKADKAALESLSDTVDAKASQSDLNTLTTTVGTKATQTELNALKSTVTSLSTTVNSKASQSDLTALTTTVGTKASQSELNSLKSTVTTLTSTVNSKPNQSDLTTLRNDMTAGDLWVSLLKQTTTSASKKISLDVSGIDFTDYWQVQIFFRTTLSDTNSIKILLNNDSTETAYEQYSPNYTGIGGTSPNYSTALCTFGNFSTPTLPIMGRLVSHVPVAGQKPCFYCDGLKLDGSGYNRCYAYYRNGTWADLSTIQLSGSASIPAGAEIFILGLRK